MFNPLSSIKSLSIPFYSSYQKRRSSQKELLKRAKLYNFGEQDQIDLISYSGLEEQANYLIMGDKFVRTLFVSLYPRDAVVGWLSMLINFNHNIDIAYHIEQVDPLAALPKLNKKITQLESRRRSMVKDGKLVDSDISDPLQSAITLKEKIQRGQEKLFQFSAYMSLTADSLEELNKVTALLETAIKSKLFRLKSATFQQIEGLQSVLPRAQNLLEQRRNLDSSTTALTFPFVSAELVQESGILYGTNKSNDSLVIVDRFSLNNANAIIFAQSGSGKSFTAKVEILRQLMQGTKVIVVDPDREYKRLAESVNGTYIRLSARSVEKINPFDLSINSKNDAEDLSEHIQDLTAIISLMVDPKDGLISDERAAVDKAILQIYKDHGFLLNPIDTPKKKKKSNRGRPPKIKTFPMLKDLYKELKSMKQRKLCNKLEKYVKGSLSSVFNSQTNIKLDNRLVVFDINSLDEQLRPIMMMVVANFIQSQVKSSPQKRILVIDEGWKLLQHQETSRFIAGLARRARKYYLGVTIISQQADDFLNKEDGKAIASQSALRILMRQDTTSIKRVALEFNLSEYEQHFLLTCDKGEALILADQIHAAVKIVASKKEHPLITTDPRELYA